MNNAPCYGYGKRCTGCHADCEDYKAFRARCDAANENRRGTKLDETVATRNHFRWLDCNTRTQKKGWRR